MAVRSRLTVQLALVTVIQHLRADAQASALWIAIDSAFRPEWALSVFSALDHSSASGDHKPATPSQAAEDRHLETLERLRVAPATSVSELIAAISDARASSRPDGTRLRIVVIDAITSLFQPSLSVGSARGHASMVATLQHLAALARSPDLPFCLLVRPTISPRSLIGIDRQLVRQRRPASAAR